MKRLGFIFCWCCLCNLYAWGQEAVSTSIRFKQGYGILDPGFADNRLNLDKLVGTIRAIQADTSYILQSLVIKGTASPIGDYSMNLRLAEKRANAVHQYLQQNLSLENVPVDIRPMGIDWDGLRELVAASDMPHRGDVLRIIDETAGIKDLRQQTSQRNRLLQQVGEGEAWRYMSDKLFGHLHSSGVGTTLTYIKKEPVVVEEHHSDPLPAPVIVAEAAAPIDTLPTEETQPAQPVVKRERTPLYWALKSNLLMDVALIPNLAAEVHLGKGWTVGAGAWFAWWTGDNSDISWRTYGAEVALRKYFGKRAAEKPLQGHHLGVYGQVLTYDFRLGSGKGIIGGQSGGSIFDHANYAFGIEYGYSLPIARRLNLDFVLGVGYMGGQYEEYRPKDGHQVWETTKDRNWIGPTKAEVTLVWLLGRTNSNAKKGGKQ